MELLLTNSTMALKLNITTESSMTTQPTEVMTSLQSTTTTSSKPPSGDGDDDDVDVVMIVGYVLFGIGALLILIGVIRFLIWWCGKRSDSKSLREKEAKELSHVRYLEEYSVRTGGSRDEFLVGTLKSSAGGSEVLKWEEGGHSNPGYSSTERPPRRGSLTGGDFDNNNGVSTPSSSLTRQKEVNKTHKTDVTNDTIHEVPSTLSSRGHSSVAVAHRGPLPTDNMIF